MEAVATEEGFIGVFRFAGDGQQRGAGHGAGNKQRFDFSIFIIFPSGFLKQIENIYANLYTTWQLYSPKAQCLICDLSGRKLNGAAGAEKNPWPGATGMGRLPAFDGVALVDVGGAGRHFVGLIGLDQILHFLAVFVVDAAGEDVDVRRVLSSTNSPSLAGDRPIWLE